MEKQVDTRRMSNPRYFGTTSVSIERLSFFSEEEKQSMNHNEPQHNYSRRDWVLDFAKTGMVFIECQIASRLIAITDAAGNAALFEDQLFSVHLQCRKASANGSRRCSGFMSQGCME